MSLSRLVTSSVAALACCWVLVACSGDDSATGSSAPPTTPAALPTTPAALPTTPAAPLTPTARLDVDMPSTLAGQQAGWVLEQLEAASGPGADQATERFSHDFLSQVAADQMAATFDDMRAFGPFTAHGYDGAQAAIEVDLAGADGAPYVLHVVVNADGLIDGLLLRPGDQAPEVTTWDELDTALTDTAADVSIYAARHEHGRWAPVYERASGEPRPMGSVFKLYVLGAVQQAVLDNQVSWDDEVTVTDDVRSLPSGTLQDADTGTTVSVAQAAEQMISISDNTATDMLMELVGRDAVEAATAAMGHHDPGLLRPFPSTRELFQLGWGEPGLREAWQQASPDQRRDILADLPGGTLDVDPMAVTDAVWPFGIGWFASAMDIAEAHRQLQELARTDRTDTMRGMLTVNTGAQIDTGTWPYAAFKGGSAPGVFALSWYLEDTDGVPHVLVVQLATESPAALGSQLTLVGIAEQGIDLLATGAS